MPDNLSIAFYLLVVGMSITFGALFLLWGLMALLTALTARSAEEESAVTAPVEPALAAPPMPETNLSERRRRAAAAAVAVALARQQAARRMATATSTVSPWQAAGRMARTGREGRERL
ncbi:MAG: OadG family protein [Roseiflexaceae bacterium]|nr:OadG family protein [Roseiflexus sp.]MDW8145632.1 OadG family protein [Roseiflexaceae bacterium]MDW8232893.1 OadG family protein [Roseiflexaceae bacterium]